MSSRRSFGINICLALVTLVILALETQHELILFHPDDSSDRQEAGQEMEEMKINAEDSVPKCAKENGRASLFVILSSGFSESRKLLTELQNHQQVFAPFSIPFGPGNRTSLRLISNALHAGKGRTIGIVVEPDFVLNDLHNWNELISTAGRGSIRFLVNYPYNLFEIALNDWTLEHPGQIDLNMFHRQLSKLWHGERAIVKVLAELEKEACVLPMSYDTMQRWPSKAYYGICAFLGVKANRTLINTVQTLPTPRTMCESVSNWDHLCANFFVCELWRTMLPGYDNNSNCSCNQISSVTSNWNQFCNVIPKEVLQD